jgi:VCBS repeat-containing protein
VASFTVAGLSGTFAAGAIATVPGVGTLVINANGSYTFTPAPNYNGPVPVATYLASDGTASTPGTLTLSVSPVNDNPIASPDAATTPEDTPVSGNLLGNDSDVDGNSLSVTSFSIAGVSGSFSAGSTASIPGVGSLVINGDGSYTFTPAANYNGAVPLVTYSVTDGAGGSASSSLSITVSSVNDNPVAVANTGTTTEDSSASGNVLPNDSDVDGDALVVAGVSFGASCRARSARRSSAPTARSRSTPTALTAMCRLPRPRPWTTGESVSDVFTYSVSDGQGGTASTTLTLTVTGTNDAPVTTADVGSTPEDTPISGNVLANDSDPDVEPLSVVSFSVAGLPGTFAAGTTATVPGVGTLVINANGSYTFTPAPNYNGAVPVATYLATDGTSSAPGTLSLSVSPVNDNPIASPDAATTPEDTPVSGNLLGNDSDVDGNTLSVSSFNIAGVSGSFAAGATASIPGVGSLLINSNGSYTFTPAADYNGAVPLVTYSVTDGAGGSASSSLSLNVTPVNDNPVAVANTGSTTEDTTASGNVLPNDSDVDGDALSVSGVSFGASSGTVGSPIVGTHGTLTLNADGSYSFVPAASTQALDTGESVSDVFTYSVSDGNGGTASTTLTLTVTGTNDAPVTTADVGSTPEDTPISGNVLANDSDPDVEPLSVVSFSVAGLPGTFAAGTTATVPGVGTLVINANGSYTFTPAPNYNGAVPLATYLATDGTSSTPGTLSLSVSPVNDNPIASPDAATTPEDTPVSGNVLGNDSDVDGNSLSVTGFSIAGVSGSFSAGSTASISGVGSLLINSDGSYTFTPAANYNGAAPLVTYSVTDGNGGSASSSLSLNVTPVNDNPVAVANTGTTTEDSSASGNVLPNDSDVDGDALAVSGVSFGASVGTVGSPIVGAHGTLTLNADGTYIYVPAASTQALDTGESVSDVFTYTISDGQGGTASTTLTLTVTGTNDAPVTTADVGSMPEDTPISGNVLANDADPDVEPLSVASFSVAGVAGTFAAGSTATVPGVGTLVINANGSYTFTPAANYNGAVPVATYLATDGTSSTPGTLTLSVSPVNDNPVAVANTGTTTEDTTASGNVLPNDSDVDGDALAVSGVSFGASVGTVGSPIVGAHGTLTLNADGTYIYVPAASTQALDTGESVSDVFTYTISDGQGGTASTTLTLTVTGTNDAPVTTADVGSMPEDTPISGNVLANDSDPDVEPLSVASFSVAGVAGTFAAGSTATVPGVGTLVINANGSYTFTPAPNYNGPVPVATYLASDGTASTPGTLTLSVSPVNDNPIASPDAATTPEDTPVSGNLLGNDSDVDGNSLSVTSFSIAGVSGSFSAGSTASIPGVGSLVINGDGSYTFTPAANYNGAVPLVTYSVTDGAGGSASSSLSITVSSVNDNPVAVANTGTTTEDSSASGNVLPNDSDVDGDALVVAGVSFGATAGTVGSPIVGTHGTLTLNADGNYTYVPASSTQALDTGESVSDVFTYSVSDGNGGSASTTLTLTVTGTNDAPVTTADVGSTPEDTPISGNVLANDSDPDVEALTRGSFSVAGLPGTFAAGTTATVPGVGTLVINANGSYTFTPAPNYNGAVPVATYLATDGTSSAPGTLSLSVSPVNDNPIASPDAATTPEDTPVSGNLLGNDSDVDGNTLSVTSFSIAGVRQFALAINSQHLGCRLAAHQQRRLLHLHARRRLQRRRPAGDLLGHRWRRRLGLFVALPHGHTRRRHCRRQRHHARGHPADAERPGERQLRECRPRDHRDRRQCHRRRRSGRGRGQRQCQPHAHGRADLHPRHALQRQHQLRLHGQRRRRDGDRHGQRRRHAGGRHAPVERGLAARAGGVRQQLGRRRERGHHQRLGGRHHLRRLDPDRRPRRPGRRHPHLRGLDLGRLAAAPGRRHQRHRGLGRQWRGLPRVQRRVVSRADHRHPAHGRHPGRHGL